MKYHLLLIIFILVLSGAYMGLYRSTSEDITITVTEKTTKYHEDGEKYLVHSSSGETFEITDTYSFTRFDSSDLYFSIDEGKTYNCKVAGWRVPYLSMYRNIIEAEEI